MSNEVNQDTQVAEKEINIFQDFAEALDKTGVFPRDYDTRNLERLYCAAESVHKHLCTLDTGYYTQARRATLISLANAYAQCHSGLRQLE